MSRIPAIDTQLRVFHAPHESEEDLRPFMDYLTQLHERVKEYHFDELRLENSPSIERDFRSTTVCPFCHVEQDSGEIGDDSMKAPKVRHHAHVADEYTTGKGGTLLPSRAVHLHVLYQVQSPPLIQQEELSIASLLS